MINWFKLEQFKQNISFGPSTNLWNQPNKKDLTPTSSINLFLNWTNIILPNLLHRKSAKSFQLTLIEMHWGHIKLIKMKRYYSKPISLTAYFWVILSVYENIYSEKALFKFFEILLFLTVPSNWQKSQRQRKSKSRQSIQSHTSTAADLQVPIYAIALFGNDTWPVTANTGIKKSLNEQPQNAVCKIQHIKI